MCLSPLKMKSKHKSCLSAARWSMYTQKISWNVKGWEFVKPTSKEKHPWPLALSATASQTVKLCKHQLSKKFLPGSESDRGSTTGDRPLDPRCDCCNDATLVMSRKAPKSKKRWKLPTHRNYKRWERDLKLKSWGQAWRYVWSTPTLFYTLLHSFFFSVPSISFFC